jgi:hypothetical protein
MVGNDKRQVTVRQLRAKRSSTRRTCKINDDDPDACLRDVLNKIVARYP